jgi:hypothetical protein
MRQAALPCGVLALGVALMAAAQQSPTTPASSPPPAAATQSASSAATNYDPRLVLSGNGETFNNNHGGGGGSANFLTNLGPGNYLGLGAEYQNVAGSHWTLGDFSGGYTFGQDLPKTTLYGEAHLGAGNISEEAFHYRVLAGGLLTTLNSWLTTQLEERYIDIDKSHGNLPKIGFSVRPTLQLMATLSYAQSFGGNLGTRLGTLRLDYVGTHFSLLAGGAYGPVAPFVINIDTGQLVVPAAILREGFVGVGKTLGRTDWQLLGDYQSIEGLRRTTITLNCTLHLAPAAH